MSNAPNPVTPPSRATASHGAADHFRVYEHSNLFYWWIVIAWGYVCALLSWLYGVPVEAFGKKVLYHPDAWVGLSFIGVLLFVIVVTNVKAEGIYSYMVLLLLAFVTYVAAQKGLIDFIAKQILELRIHLNLAFYLFFSTMLLTVWLLVMLLVDHFSWWEFKTGQIMHRHRLGQGTDRAYTTEGTTIYRLPDDIFRHKVLGLRWLGIGTADFIITPKDAHPVEIRNVMHPNRELRRMEKLVATKLVATRPAKVD